MTERTPTRVAWAVDARTDAIVPTWSHLYS